MLSPGMRLDRYIVGHLLGKGGIAHVYAVQHSLLGSWHALKVLHAADATTQERLLREGRVQARLDPNLVVPVTDVIQVREVPALVMPLVRGQALDDLLRPGPLPIDEAYALFSTICRSVAHAHDQGVVHRDLKPANVLVDPSSAGLRVRVADFGLVRALSSMDMTVDDGARTRRGVMMGSPAYAAPEQLTDAARADQRADVWSLGVILYELLTGGRPFNGADLRELILCVCRGEMDLAPVPERGRGLIAELLALDPKARPATAGQVLARLPDQGRGTIPVEGELFRRLVVPDLPSPTPEVASPVGATIAPESYGTASAQISHSLPAERDRFVGRRADAARLQQMLADTRLVTITGIGGTGKTRFVVHCGWKELASWPGGVWFCDLADATSEADITRAMAEALRVPLSGSDPVALLGHILIERGRCLVVLDNFEQLVAHASPTVGRWMDVAPDATFLVTSREPLGIRGEQVFGLSPLPADEAVALFIERARASQPDFDPDEGEARSVRELVRLLDHLPLAVELAAARIRTLSPGRILARMDDRFRLLTTRGRKDRSATLRATLDWSWDLLHIEERSALAQLAVFEGGFDLEAAEAVVEVEGEAWVLDLVESLVDKSMVRNLGDDRFGMLVSVQAYASEKLDASGLRGSAEGRHAAWFAGMGTPEALRALALAGGFEARTRLRGELDNLLAAHRRNDHGATLAALALAAWAVFILQGPFEAGRALLEATHDRDDVPAPRRVDLRRMIAAAHDRMGQATEGRPWAERAIELALELGDRRREAEARLLLGNLLRASGDLEGALAQSEQARDLCVQVGARQTEGIAAGNLAVVLQAMGKMEAAESTYLEALGISRSVGDERQAGLVLANYGAYVGQRGRLNEARSLFEEALDIAIRLDALRTQAFMQLNLGLVSNRQGDHDAARDRFEQALSLAKSTGGQRQQAACLGYLAAAHRDSGQTEAAKATFARFLRLATEVGDPRRQGIAHGGLGGMARLEGRFDEAERHVCRALELHESIGAVSTVPVWHLELGRIALERHDLGAALEHLERGLETAAPYPPILAEIRVCMARLSLQRGQIDAAHHELELAHRIGADGRVAALLHSVKAQACIAQGDPQGAAAALGLAEAERAWVRPGTEIGDRVIGLRLALSPQG